MDRRYFLIWWIIQKNYNEESDEGYFLEVGILYLEKLLFLNNG